MKIERGSPIEYGLYGAKARLDKLNSIYFINSGVALDLGAGKGVYSKILAQKKVRIFSTDINYEFIKDIDKSTPNLYLSVSDATKLPFKDLSFNYVFAIETLEHVEGLDGALEEIKRVVKNEGIIYITIPNKFFPLETHHVYFFKKKIDGRLVPFLSMFDLIHKKIGSARRFSIKELQNIFQKKDFSLIGWDYLMPVFDNFKFGKKYFKPITDFIGKTKFKFISPTLIAVFKKN